MLNLQALVTIYMALGIRKATSTIIKFPAIVLTPAFTFWAFGPISSNACCVYKREEPKIHLSYRFTWINAIFTSCTTAGLMAYAWFVNRDLIWGSRVANWVRGLYELLFYVGCALFPLSFLTLVLIQCLPKCSCCPCNENCLPMKPKVIYDTEKMEKC